MPHPLNYTAIADWCRRHCGEETAHALRVADEVSRNYFVFDFPWDMERTYEPVEFKDSIQWDYMPGKDNEFIFQFNRHRYFLCLGQAYHLTGDERYALQFVRLMTDWIRQMPCNPKYHSTTWRSLEVGLRGEIWTKAMAYFADSPSITADIRAMYEETLWQHADLLAKPLSVQMTSSNWSILQDHGLFSIAMALPSRDKNGAYAALALERLEKECAMQIPQDGMHLEQSPMYHNEIMHCLMDTLRILKDHGREIPAFLTSAVRRMAYANLKSMRPNRRQFQTGDSDDTDLRDKLTTAAWLLQDPVLKFGAYAEMDYDNLWDFGLEAAEEYAAIEAKEPDFTNAFLEDSGNYYLRSGWGERDDVLHFQCGFVGSGHGHADKLHVDLSLLGEDILVDSGRFTYVDGPKRMAYKRASAHNTITMDHREFLPFHGAWGIRRIPRPLPFPVIQSQGMTLLRAGHTGYVKLFGSALITRKVLWLAPGLYIIADVIHASGRHSYQSYFHFNNEGAVTLDGSIALYQGQQARARFFFLTPHAKIRKTPVQLSRHYNHEEPGEAIRVDYSATGNQIALTVIAGGHASEDTPISAKLLSLRYSDYPLPRSPGCAVEIKTPEADYTAAFLYKETNFCTRTENGLSNRAVTTVWKDGVPVPLEW